MLYSYRRELFQALSVKRASSFQTMHPLSRGFGNVLYVPREIKFSGVGGVGRKYRKLFSGFFYINTVCFRITIPQYIHSEYYYWVAGDCGSTALQIQAFIPDHPGHTKAQSKASTVHWNLPS